MKSLSILLLANYFLFFCLMHVLEGLPNWKAENLYSKQKPKQTTTYQYQGSAQEELHQ